MRNTSKPRGVAKEIGDDGEERREEAQGEEDDDREWRSARPSTGSAEAARCRDAAPGPTARCSLGRGHRQPSTNSASRLSQPTSTLESICRPRAGGARLLDDHHLLPDPDPVLHARAQRVGVVELAFDDVLGVRRSLDEAQELRPDHDEALRRGASPATLNVPGVADALVELAGAPAHRDDVHLAHELGDEAVDRARVDLLRRADLDDPPRLHHGDPVRHHHRLLERVGDVDEGLAGLLVDVLELLLERLLELVVEGRQRLVEEQDLGIVGEGAGEGDALALAARAGASRSCEK